MAYDEHLSAVMIQNDVLDSAKLEERLKDVRKDVQKDVRKDEMKNVFP